MNALDHILFIALPYAAIAVFLVGFTYRYRQTGFKVSSLSAQFLEGRKGFFGTVPFHVGIIVVFLGHLAAFLIPKTVLWWNGDPARLIILEATGVAFGIGMLFGLGNLFLRRLTHPRLQVVTNRMDIVIEIILLIQIVLGLWTAIGFRWGSSWFAADLSPYLKSIVMFSPDASAVVAMPWQIQAHIVGAFLILFLLPFTRLVHFLVMPLHYISRPYQQVMWYWNRRSIRDPRTPWSEKRPKNN